MNADTVLSLLPARPRLLALGEPTHGEDVLLDVRNDLFRQLVEQAGYRTIVLEIDCLRAQLVDDYVTSGAGSLDAVMAQGFSHEWGAYPPNRSLVSWMRSYNEDRPAPEQVRFAGFDGPLEITAASSPRQALTALHGYLADRVDPGLLPCTLETLEDLLGADDLWTNPAAMRDPAQSVGQTASADRLRRLADNLVALLEIQTPLLIADGWSRAWLNARTAVGLLRYHFWMADSSPSRLPWLLGIRAAMMAANLLALAERSPTLVYAHNSHLQRDRSSMRMGGMPLEWWSAGATVSSRLGDDYAFLPTAVGTLRTHNVETPPPNTIEGFLYAQPGDRFIADPRRLAAETLTPRVSPWFGYAPLDPAHLPRFDGIVFIRDAPPS
ncbi:erythromycin esterase family protein [Paractinoplanes durhamensis]|uniref:Erythromycin esterase n=1 Tax=Paractinoplanes durhamensis TaxID=113563 RepID=A0ABQ3YXX8_9ACTN|nr:erythromycin esterase family protein [Actinoplanes durhamensis]GIE02380.1 erythromycin esterase [Actinoplanes durhamensis]